MQKQLSQERGNETAVSKERGPKESRYHLPTNGRREAEDEIQNIDTIHNKRGQHKQKTGNRYLSQREPQGMKDKPTINSRKKKQRSVEEKKRPEMKKEHVDKPIVPLISTNKQMITKKYGSIIASGEKEGVTYTVQAKTYKSGKIHIVINIDKKDQ